jgi:hypothetical protein
MYNLKRNILVAMTAMELNFDAFKSGGLHENHRVASDLELGNHLTLRLKFPRLSVRTYEIILKELHGFS